MIRATKAIEFDAGHRVPDHLSKCRSPHGHRYRVVLEVSGPLIESGAETGMVRDFGVLKDALVRCVHDPFDHAFLVYDADSDMRAALMYGDGWKVAVLPVVPTAEMLASHIAGMLVVELGDDVVVETVTVWETPTCSASWTRDG